MLRGKLILLLASLILAALPFAAPAQSYPNKPVKIIVPFTAGGLTDVLARGLGQELTKIWGQQVIVENRPGANTIIGAEVTAKSPADGYTILMANDPTLSTNQYLYRKLPYDPVKDFTPVINLVMSTNILVAHPSFPAKTLQEFIALAKSKPGAISYGTFGPGSATHVDMEALAALVGIKLNHVPYKGIADVLPAVIGGQIDVALSGVPPTLPLVRSGKLRVIAVPGEKRLSVLPDAPSFTEAGVPNFDSRSWFGLVVPVGTPRPVIDKIATDIAQITARVDFSEKFVTGVGMTLLNLGPDQYAEFLKADREQQSARIKNIDVKLD